MKHSYFFPPLSLAPVKSQCNVTATEAVIVLQKRKKSHALPPPSISFFVSSVLIVLFQGSNNLMKYDKLILLRQLQCSTLNVVMPTDIYHYMTVPETQFVIVRNESWPILIRSCIFIFPHPFIKSMKNRK